MLNCLRVPAGPALAKRQSNMKATQDFFAHKAADTYFAKSSDNLLVKGTLAFSGVMFAATILGASRAVASARLASFVLDGPRR